MKIQVKNLKLLEEQLNYAQSALLSAIRNYTHALHFENEYTNNTPQFDQAFYDDYVHAEVLFWADDIEFWQNQVHQLHRLIVKYTC